MPTASVIIVIVDRELPWGANAYKTNCKWHRPLWPVVENDLTVFGILSSPVLTASLSSKPWMSLLLFIWHKQSTICNFRLILSTFCSTYYQSARKSVVKLAIALFSCRWAHFQPSRVQKNRSRNSRTFTTLTMWSTRDTEQKFSIFHKTLGRQKKTKLPDNLEKSAHVSAVERYFKIRRARTLVMETN